MREYDGHGIDFIDRDPNNINDFIYVEFNHVIGEPDGTHSTRCVWNNSVKCYYCSKGICYKILSTCLGIFIAIFWGCLMGCISFTSIWHCAPLVRFYQINMHPIRKFIKIYASTFAGPMCEVRGLIFSRIFVVNSHGQPRRGIYDFTLNDRAYKRMLR